MLLVCQAILLLEVGCGSEYRVEIMWKWNVEWRRRTYLGFFVIILGDVWWRLGVYIRAGPGLEYIKRVFEWKMMMSACWGESRCPVRWG